MRKFDTSKPYDPGHDLTIDLGLSRHSLMGSNRYQGNSTVSCAPLFSRPRNSKGFENTRMYTYTAYVYMLWQMSPFISFSCYSTNALIFRIQELRRARRSPERRNSSNSPRAARERSANFTVCSRASVGEIVGVRNPREASSSAFSLGDPAKSFS